MTGFEFSNVFDLKIDKAYSAFLNPTKKNRLFKEALLTSIEKKYRSLDKQKEYDEISTAIKTDVTFSINNNRIATAPIQIALASSVSTTVTITTFLPHNLIAGDAIVVAGISGGVVNINGSWTVATVVSDYIFTYTSSIAPSGAITANTGYVTSSKMITDYLHLLTVKTKFVLDIGDIAITAASNTSTITLTVSGQNNLRTGELVFISGVLGNTNANGYRYIDRINKTKFALYSDAKLTTPVAGNGSYTSGGEISKVYYKVAMQQVSDRKISTFNNPRPDAPNYEMSRNKIKFLPLTETCSEITVDYISNDIKFIISTDTAIDLEQYYPAKFLYYVADEAANLFAQSVKDNELFQTSDFQNKTNP